MDITARRRQTPRKGAEMKLSDSMLGGDVVGRNLEGGTLADLLGEAPAFLVFLRHLG
jgi:hypothetical protein